MRLILLVASCLLAGCDLDVYPAATPIAPTAPGAVTVTNTNTNTVTIDRSDTEPTTPTSGSPSAPTTGALGLRRHACEPSPALLPAHRRGRRLGLPGRLDCHVTEPRRPLGLLVQGRELQRARAGRGDV